MSSWLVRNNNRSAGHEVTRPHWLGAQISFGQPILVGPTPKDGCVGTRNGCAL